VDAAAAAPATSQSAARIAAQIAAAPDLRIVTLPTRWR
jgi:hypothetical protein